MCVFTTGMASSVGKFESSWLWWGLGKFVSKCWQHHLPTALSTAVVTWLRSRCNVSKFPVLYSSPCIFTRQWREREGSTAWKWTDSYCHTLQCCPERCAVKLLQESIDEGQMPGWEPSETKLPYYHASVTDCMSVAACCCIRNIVGLRRWISTCSDPIRLSHTHTQQKSPLSVSNLMGPLPYIWLRTEESATAKCGTLVRIHHIYFIHPLKSLQYCLCFTAASSGGFSKKEVTCTATRSSGLMSVISEAKRSVFVLYIHEQLVSSVGPACVHKSITLY